MDNAKLKKNLRALRSSIEDFLDEMELDEGAEKETEQKSDDKKPSDKKFSSAVEEDKDGRKLSH